MANIEKRNILIEFLNNAPELTKDVQGSTKAVEGLQGAVEDVNDSLSDAFKTDLAEKMIKIFRSQGVELTKVGKNLDEVKKGIEDAFNDLSPDQFAAAVKAVNRILEETEGKIEDVGRESNKSFSRARKAAAAAGRGINRALDKVATVAVRTFGGVFRGIGSGLRGAFDFILSAGGLLGALGIADLIAEWSPFSQQLRDTFKVIPGANKTFDRLVLNVRKLGDLFARTIAPFVLQITEGFNNWIESLDLTLLTKLFKGIGTVFQTLASQIGRLFGQGEGSVTQSIINFGINVVAVLNGIIGAFDEFLLSARAFFLEFASQALKLASGLQFLPQVGAALSGLQAVVANLAKDARKNLPSISEEFLKFYNQIKNLEGDPITIDEIVPALSEEEQEKVREQLDKTREAYQGWLDFIKSIRDETFGFGTPFEQAVESLDRFRQRMTLLSQEAIQLFKDGIISEEEFDKTTAAIELLGERGFRQLRKDLKEFELEELKSRDTRLDAFKKQLQEEVKAEIRAQEERERRRAEFLQTLDDTTELFTAVADGTSSVLDSIGASIATQIANLDALGAAQEKRVEQALALAEGGNTALIEAEERRLQEINDAREQAARREREVAAVQVAIAQAVAVAQGIRAVVTGFQGGNPILGIINAVALAATLASSIIAIRSAFGNIPAFAEGSSFVEGPEGRDKVLSRLSRGERVLTKGQNRKVGGHTTDNDTLVRRALIGAKIERGEFNILSADLPRPSVIADLSGIGDVSKGLLDIQRSQEDRLDNLSKQVGLLTREVANLAVNFNITEEGIEASVRGVQNRRNFKTAMRR